MDNKYLSVYEKQKKYFLTKETYNYAFQKQMLLTLKQMLIKNEKAIMDALYLDLGKSNYEAYMTELGLVLNDINFAIKHLKKWMKPKRVKTNISNFPSKSMIYHDPYGVCLIMSPWNYPVNLAFEPLIGAIAGGNTCIIKMSEYSTNTSVLLEKLFNETFDEKYIKAYHGDVTETTEILKLPFDFIFFTGSEKVGKIVMASAASHLTKVVLELGGKSPTIVDDNVNIELVTKRIAFGKIINAGQTCVAPDYIYVHENIKPQFINALIKEIKLMLGSNPLTNPDYPKIINERHYQRILSLIDQSKVIYGGKGCNLRIEPTIMDNVTYDDAVMQEEIFGPIFPIMSFKDIDEIISEIECHPEPLALYLFSNNKEIKKKILKMRFGGGCINDTLMHLSSETLPFGGVNNSGMGSYHGKYSFSTFTREKGVLSKSTHIDIKLRYHPYNEKKQKIVRKILK